MYRMVLQSKESWQKGPFHKSFGWTPDYDGWSLVVLVLQDPRASEMVKFYTVLCRVSRGRNPWSFLGCD